MSSPPLSPKAPTVVDGESAGGGGGGGEDGAEAGVNEQQQQAMQQEERILTEQIESLQKEKYDVSLKTLLRSDGELLVHLLPKLKRYTKTIALDCLDF